MPTGRYSIAQVGGLKISARRAVVFLVCNGELNGKPKFDKLPRTQEQQVRDRFDHWIDGHNGPKNYFHGWDEPPYEHCFCFKWKDNTVHQRFYGFKHHPQRDKRFELCVLVFHAAKTTGDTDFSYLRAINQLREDPNVI